MGTLVFHLEKSSELCLTFCALSSAHSQSFTVISFHGVLSHLSIMGAAQHLIPLFCTFAMML